MTGPPLGTTARGALRDVWDTVKHADLAIAYCAVVTAITLWVHVQPAPRQEEMLDRVSSNLSNLRSEPFVSMIGSAFVVEGVLGLVLVAQLLVVLAYLQRFVGRLAAVVVGLAGHVGAGLVVAVGLATGIFHGFVDESVAEATDVGVSYVMACATGFLVLAVPRRWRWWYLCGAALYWLVPGAFSRTFTDAGHATALAIGLLLALVSSRVVAADRQARAHAADPPGPR
ncbi:rhomboid-like protein [Cellulomonas sp. URHE0023]|uniref:rhomboid-like protein n=1 Tax=Cellulomonas sp. URHE0023 TaxID=1380354 RepID=UPI0006919833|nr:rhomboid-like protein [Cellulomonas sp. URHE0023]